MEVNMGTLEKLKLVALAPKRKKSATDERRDKMVSQLTEQLKVVEAALGGPAYVRKKIVWETDGEGNRKRVEADARLRQWWQEQENGTVQFAVRYGTKPLEMRTGLAAVEVAKLADLPAMIKTLIAAVQAGELDTQMAMAAVGRKPKLR
ncbi:MAG: hypothetical protein Q27BPR15_10685 [Rhodobacter sp. CACIA14H1]|nr:MAG: hypothetical protein Q27BPR15_10685 [Rhodobacter sp. CACIA14H1]